MPMRPVLDAPTATEIATIAAMPDGAIRNLWITWSYYRLNQAMAEITGRQDLTWCGFAVWASKTAGTFIREEEAGPVIERWIQGAHEHAGRVRLAVARAIGIHHDDPVRDAASPHDFSLRRVAARVCGDVGQAIAAGNQDVFRHIAPPFANLVALWRQRGGRLDAGDRAAFLASLDDPRDPQARFLTRAFAATFDAIATSEPRTRAQRMLEANALIGCAEQTRVQPFIEQSMNGPIHDIFQLHLRRHLHLRFPAVIAHALHWILRGLGRALEREFQDVSTKWMMRLDVPGAALRLGENVPPLPDGRMYPTELATVDAPEPAALLTELCATDASKCAATDWVRYADRMRYIGVLFRSRQQDPTLWAAPFTDAQIAALSDGRLPPGPLS